MVSWISKELPKVVRNKSIEEYDMKEMKAKKETKKPAMAKHMDAKEDKKMVKKMVKKSCVK